MRIVCKEHGRVAAYRILQKWTNRLGRVLKRRVYVCVVCRRLDAKIDHWKHRERRRKTQAAWRARNRERRRAYWQEYKRTHAESIRMTQKMSRAKHREARLAKRRAQYAAQRQEAA